MVRKLVGLALASPLILAPVAPPPAQHKPPNLCSAVEEVIFACRIGAKRVSVCGGHDGGRRYAQYRYGTLGHIELAHPATAIPGAGDMRFASIMYSGGGEGQVIFANEGVQYIVFSSMTRTRFDGQGNDPAFDSGVAVMRGGKTVATLHCSPRDGGNVDYNLAEKYMPEREPIYRD